MVPGLLDLAPPTDGEEHTETRCDKFAKHFADKVDQIRHDLDAILAVPSDVLGHLSILSCGILSSLWKMRKESLECETIFLPP